MAPIRRKAQKCPFRAHRLHPVPLHGRYTSLQIHAYRAALADRIQTAQLANAFSELTDAKEQRERYENDMKLKQE